MKTLRLNGYKAALIAFLIMNYFSTYSQGGAGQASLAVHHLHVPADITLRCGMDYHSLDVTGRAWLDFYPSGVEITYTDRESYSGGCGEREITRRFEVWKNGKYRWGKDQVIHIVPDPEADVLFPGDYCFASAVAPDDLHPDNLPAEFGWPKTLNGCDRTGFSYVDRATWSGPGKRRVLREWQAFDRCNGQVIEKHTQVLEHPVPVVSNPDSDNGGDYREDGFQLYQNRPNPFSKGTVIGYVLARAAEVELTVRDVAGRIVYHKEMVAAKGYNEIRLDIETEGLSGIFWYTLKTSGHVATKKMIIAH